MREGEDGGREKNWKAGPSSWQYASGLTLPSRSPGKYYKHSDHETLKWSRILPADVKVEIQRQLLFKTYSGSNGIL